MATFLASPLVGSISGPIGGVEFARSRAGNIVKQRRRRRAAQSPAQLDHTALLATFAAIWRSAQPATRKAWTTYAASQTIKNRWAQDVPEKPYAAAYKFHLFIYQWFDGQFPGTPVLLPPPLATDKPGSIYFLGAQFFTTPEYVIDSRINNAESYKEFLWAGPARNQSWSGRLNWRFIGCQAKTADAMDWTSYFLAPRIQWEFQAGQILWIKVAHARADRLSGTNSPWFKPIGVMAPP